MNIYQITNEKDLMYLLHNKFKNNIATILFTNGNNFLSSDLKKTMKRNLSKKYEDVLFIYVNIESYDIDKSSILENVDNQHYPYVLMYWNGCEVGNVKNSDRESLNIVVEKIYENIKKHLHETTTNINAPQINVGKPHNNIISRNKGLQESSNTTSIHEELQILPNTNNNNDLDNMEFVDNVNEIENSNDVNGNIHNEYEENVNYIDEQEIMYNAEKMEKLDELKKLYTVKELDRIIELKEKTSK